MKDGKVTTWSKEGNVTEQTFYDAPVEMSTLSVAELSQKVPTDPAPSFDKEMDRSRTKLVG